MKLNKIKIAFFLCILFIIISIGAQFLFSENYQKIYGTPETQDCTMDFFEYDTTKATDCNTSGEWEFYYNKWIVSDDLDVEPDGKIDILSRWTNEEYCGEVLSKDGYASYAITLKNLPKDTIVDVKTTYKYSGIRIFLNDTLVMAEGDMEKGEFVPSFGISETFYDHYIVEENEDVRLVVEISSTDRGGIFRPIWVNPQASINSSKQKFFDIFIYVAMGIMITLIIYSFAINVSMHGKMKNKMLPYFIVLLFLRFIFGTDGQYLVDVRGIVTSYYLSTFLSYVFYLMMTMIFSKMISDINIIKLSKTERVIYIAANISLFIMAYHFRGYRICATLQIIAYCIPYIALWKMTKEDFNSRNKILYLVIATLIATALSVETIDLNGMLKFGTDSFWSYCMLLVMILLSLNNFMNYMQLEREMLEISQKAKEYAEVKEIFLREQIKPHFICNSMTAIKYLYKKDISLGESAIDKFSKYLRTNVDSQNETLIKFDEELGNVMNFFELQNLRYDGNLVLLFDIECSNFKVPILSIQPIIENAVKHSNIQSKKDGHILLSSRAKEKTIEITISDNGQGFYKEKNGKPNSQGIRNIKERFEILMNGSISLETTVGKGTVVVISIPKETAEYKEDEYASDNN